MESTLKVTIEGGPTAGKTLEFTSREVVTIGRCFRGNTIVIKEDGISAKHLSIQFDSAAANWTLLDLKSSNGTILNFVSLVPLQPTVIKDGDTIKIGEYTSLVVGIEIWEIEASAVEVASPVRQRGRPRKVGASLKHEGAEVRASPRRTRNSKKEEQVLKSMNVGASDCKEEGVLARKELKGRKVRRNLTDEEVDNGGVDEYLGREGCGGSEDMAAVGEGLLNVSLGGGGVDVREETRETNELNSTEMAAVERSLPNRLLEGVGVDGRDGKRVDNDVNSGERGSKWLLKDGLLREPDLANMTLGDWYDYLEAYFTKTIYDETEAIISSMKEHAAKVHAIRLQHQKTTGKGPIE